MVLMEFYEERLKAQQLPIDLLNLFAKALTIYRAPMSVISKLYKFVRAQNDQLPSVAIRKLIVAFCACKVTLIDMMPEEVIINPHKKIRKRYQDMLVDK